MPEPCVLYANRALLPEGWAERVAVSVDSGGDIESVDSGLEAAPPGAERVGILLPGMPNCHSHAFQRAMAGLTEVRGTTDDSFWSWRATMYDLLQSIGPAELEAIAEQLYIEMLKLGYTGVGEFHYLHRASNGQAYDDPAEMSRRVIEAARTAGIHITHLPVLYCHSDFGSKPPEDSQRRFVHSVDEYLQLYYALAGEYRETGGVHLGVAPHSLRAVTEEELREVVAAVETTVPVHIHIAEQEREVDACLAAQGQRPVAWLLDRFAPNERWCLVHATHLDEKEMAGLAASSAVAGLCPTTEANLGDGIFPAQAYLAGGGKFAVGSDSQVTVDPVQELRLLEYAQRFQHRRRNLLASAGQPSVGESLYRGALAGGASALGIATGAIRPGARADLVVLDDEHPGLYGRRASHLLDSWIFACNQSPVRDVMVGGDWRVRAGTHPREETVAEKFKQVMNRLCARAGC